MNESTPVSDGRPDAPQCLTSGPQHSVVQLDRVTRVALMITPPNEGSSTDQGWKALATIRDILERQAAPMTVTKQTVFVRDESDIPVFRELFDEYFGSRLPPTTFVVQPPCDGQALAIEAWALGGEDIRVHFPLPDLVTVSYDGLRWIHVGGIHSRSGMQGAYEEAADAFKELVRRLAVARATLEDVSRIWIYQSGITEVEQTDSGDDVERYREMNRARTDFFYHQESSGRMMKHHGRTWYPASTGIGMRGHGMGLSCLGLQTRRGDVVMRPLENPKQTSAFDYSSRYSAKSPKFSRAMAVQIGDFVTTWVSGTASILNSETVHEGDIEKQTHQTIDNIERLISAENFRQHDLPECHHVLTDLAKVRVYVKRMEDYERCKTICRQRLGDVPMIFALADVCRPELLVEIEGVAFANAGT